MKLLSLLENVDKQHKENLLKRAHVIYKALKNGTFKSGYNGRTYRYELVDAHFFYNSLYDDVHGIANTYKQYLSDDETGEEVDINVTGYDNYQILFQPVVEKFAKFNIRFYLNNL
jgi:hypothetical protein